MKMVFAISLCLVVLHGCAPVEPLQSPDAWLHGVKRFSSIHEALSELQAAARQQKRDQDANNRLYEALYAVEDWPQVSPITEKRIGSVLIALLEDPDRGVHQPVGYALGRRRHGEAIPKLFALLDEHADHYPLLSFYYAYRDCRKDPPVESLRRGLQSPQEEVRRTVIVVTGLCEVMELGDDVGRLLEQEPSEESKTKAIAAVVSLRHKASLPVLVKYAQSNSPRLQSSAGWALTQLGDDDLLPVILPLLNSPDENVRAHVADGLATMPLKDTGKAVEALVPHLADESSKVRDRVAHTLGRLGGWGFDVFPRVKPVVSAKSAVTVIKCLPDRDRTIAIAALRADLASDELGITQHLPLERCLHAWFALIELGDQEVIMESVRRCRKEGVSGLMARTWMEMQMSRCAQPMLIPELMKDVQREESAELKRYSSEFSSYPPSVDASLVVCRIIQNAPDFTPAVKAWAEDLWPQQLPLKLKWRRDQVRDQVRRWWAQNKESIINTKYGVVKPPAD